MAGLQQSLQAAADPSLQWNTLIPGLQAAMILGQRSGQGSFCNLCRGKTIHRGSAHSPASGQQPLQLRHQTGHPRSVLHKTGLRMLTTSASPGIEAQVSSRVIACIVTYVERATYHTKQRTVPGPRSRLHTDAHSVPQPQLLNYRRWL